MGMMRKCSQCGKAGHNSRTCTTENGQSVKLFGVQLARNVPSDSSFGFRKSSISPNESSGYELNNTCCHSRGTSQRLMRKKGVPWSEEEHRFFLLGLQKLGKGDWRGISRNFVTTRTSTQVASHAQKYFLRQRNGNTNGHWLALLPMMGRKEPQLQQIHRNECSLSIGMFPKPVDPNLDCIYSKEKHLSPPFKVHEIPHFRVFDSSATRSSPSLELSLAAPLPLASSHQPNHWQVLFGRRIL